MKHPDAFRSAEAPAVAPGTNHRDGQKPAFPKPVGPVTYTVRRGADVFWSGRPGNRDTATNRTR